MFFPPIGARIVNSNDLGGVRVHGCEVRSFAQIATLTGPSQIRRRITAGVLFGNYMVQMKRPERKIVFVKTAIFTSPSGALADQLTYSRRDQAPGCSAR